MMSAIENELERENPNYAHLTITFGMMQHAANEGTGGDHYDYLERLWNMFNLEKRWKKCLTNGRLCGIFRY